MSQLGSRVRSLGAGPGPPSSALGATMVAAPAVTAQAPLRDLLYVCVQDEATIAVIDMTTGELLRRIDLQSLGYPATAKPHYVVVEPDGAHWYVSLIGAGKVVKFDAADKVVAEYATETPGMLALVPGSSQLLVSRSMSAVNPPQRVALLDRATMRGEELSVLFPRPHPMAATAAGYAYTGSLGVNQVATIELARERVTLSAVAGPTHSMVQFDVSPDGQTMVASSETTGRLLVFSLADPAAPALMRQVTVGAMAFDPKFTPDGRSVWVPVKGSSEIVVVDATTWTETRRLQHASFQQPHQIVFSMDGATAFVTNNNTMDHMADPSAHAGHAGHAGSGGTASLSIVDVASGAVRRAIPLGRNLTGMGTRARQ
jgi:DNA-binding beta-propeller fold protein YncE